MIKAIFTPASATRMLTIVYQYAAGLLEQILAWGAPLAYVIMGISFFEDGDFAMGCFTLLAAAIILGVFLQTKTYRKILKGDIKYISSTA